MRLRRAIALFRGVREFLAGNSCLIHEATFGNREHRHALLVAACGRRVLLAAARARILEECDGISVAVGKRWENRQSQ